MSAHSDTATNPAVDNSLDDIFGSSTPPETRKPAATDTTTAPSSTAEPSDLPSLRRQHVTAGYRDGVSVSKGEHVQRGFDAGFPIGAQLGMRAGTVLGILEGITRGLEDRGVSGVVKKPAARGGAGSASRRDETRSSSSAAADDSRRRLREQVLKVYGDAVKALDVQAVFTGFEAGTGGECGGEVRETAEAQLRQKGDVVVAEWEGRVTVPRWEENMEALEMKRENGSERQCQGKGEGGVGDKGAAGERN